MPAPTESLEELPVAGDAQLRVEVLALLNEIIDPCSAANAVPAGLVDMGLIRSLTFEALAPGQWRCDVKLCVTHAFCMMTGIFVHEIDKRLKGHSALAAVNVELDCSSIWTEEFMSADYRARLEAQRRQRQLA